MVTLQLQETNTSTIYSIFRCQRPAGPDLRGFESRNHLYHRLELIRDLHFCRTRDHRSPVQRVEPGDEHRRLIPQRSGKEKGKLLGFIR